MRPLPIIAILLILAFPAFARADVRSGSVDDPREDTSHSLDPNPDDISFVSASYDTEAGSLTISARYWNTPSDPNANRSFPPLDFSLGKECDESMPLNGTFSGDASWDGGSVGDGDYVFNGSGTVQLDGFQGTMSADPTMSADHQTISVTFQNGAFIHQDWRCVSGQLDPSAHGTDTFSFHFDGYTPAKLTPAIAAKTFTAALVTRFGKTFSKSKPRYLACPQEQFTTLAELPSVDCAAEFRSGRTWRNVTGSVTADGPRLVPAIGKVRRFLRRWSNCSKSKLRKAHLTGTLASNAGDCSTAAPAQIAATAKRRKLRRTLTISSASLDQAGFATIATYRCGVKRAGGVVTTTCANKLGDSFRYTFALNRL